MRRFRSAMMGFGLTLAAAFTGCGGDSGPAPGAGFLDSGTAVEFKSTDTNQFNPMIKQMQENMKNRAYTKKPIAPKKEEEKKKG
jgi:hypothetical protein